MYELIIGFGAWIALFGSMYVYMFDLIPDTEKKLILIIVSPGFGGYISYIIYRTLSESLYIIGTSYILMFRVPCIVFAMCMLIFIGIVSVIYMMLRMENKMTYAEMAQAEQIHENVITTAPTGVTTVGLHNQTTQSEVAVQQPQSGYLILTTENSDDECGCMLPGYECLSCRMTSNKFNEVVGATDHKEREMDMCDQGDGGDMGDGGDSGDTGDDGDSSDEGDEGDSGDEGDMGDEGDDSTPLCIRCERCLGDTANLNTCTKCGEYHCNDCMSSNRYHCVSCNSEECDMSDESDLEESGDQKTTVLPASPTVDSENYDETHATESTEPTTTVSIQESSDETRLN